MTVFTGVGVALVTLFADDGQADPAATAALARELTDRGVQSVLACGTTGEASTLSGAARVAVISAVRDAVPNSVPVIAGTVAATAEQAALLTAAACGAGADAVLAWPPPGSEDLPGYFGALATAADGKPVLAYHIPWVSAPGVPVAAMASLPVVGVKDSSGSPDRLLDEVANYPGDTYVGSSALLALAGPLGAAGAILALANLEPERCVKAFAGDAGVQLELAEQHLRVKEGGPAVIKMILAAERGTSTLARIGAPAASYQAR
jgi:4-hydroxy-tetrahydrodipicolinate synthase